MSEGKTTSGTDDNLYNMMPLNAKLAVVQRLGNWTNTVEAQLVDAKDDVSQIRNELKTAGYGLLNLRSSYGWKQARFDVGMENVFDRFYNYPAGWGICRARNDHAPNGRRTLWNRCSGHGAFDLCRREREVLI